MTDDKPEESSGQPNPNQTLVRVFDTQQESEAFVVQGLLQSSGIESEITSLDATQDVFPGVGGMVILTREEDAAEAKRVIKESTVSLTDSEIAEGDLNAGPATEA